MERIVTGVEVPRVVLPLGRSCALRHDRTMRTRLLLAVPVAALALTSMAACTSTSYTCSGSSCTLTLSGAGAETEILDDTVSVRLAGASGGTAEFSVSGESATCAEGDSLTVADFAVTCTAVGDDSLTLEIS